jgi:hypothetical protein
MSAPTRRLSKALELVVACLLATHAPHAQAQAPKPEPVPAACLSGEGLTEVIPLPEGMTFGMYTRMHPDGDYIIGTGYPGSFILNLKDRDSDGMRKPVKIKTPLNVEAYATEGSWKFVSDSRRTNSAGRMVTKMYTLDELLAKGPDAKPITTRNEANGRTEELNDDWVNEWYQTAADLPSADPKVRKFRLVQYLTLSFSDYEVKVDDQGQPQAYNRTQKGRLCGNLGDFSSATPILSKDGTEIAMYAQGNKGLGTYIFKIASNGHCTITDYVGPTPAKGSFSYPTPGSRGRFAYIGEGYDRQGQARYGLVAFNRDTGGTEWIDTEIPLGQYTAYSYPGFLRDGRIMIAQNVGNARALIVTRPQLSPKAQCANCVPNTENTPSAKKLAELWYSVCSRSNFLTGPVTFDPKTQRLVIDPTSCKSLVKNYFDKQVAAGQIEKGQVSKDDLLAACAR